MEELIENVLVVTRFGLFYMECCRCELLISLNKTNFKIPPSCVNIMTDRRLIGKSFILTKNNCNPRTEL